MLRSTIASNTFTLTDSGNNPVTGTANVTPDPVVSDKTYTRGPSSHTAIRKKLLQSQFHLKLLNI